MLSILKSSCKNRSRKVILTQKFDHNITNVSKIFQYFLELPSKLVKAVKFTEYEFSTNFNFLFIIGRSINT